MGQANAGARVVRDKATADSDKIGLCSSCAHGRNIAGARSSFMMCERSVDDASYARYPRLPVHTCGGYELAPPPRQTP
jgi:hypothetical protein